MKWRVGRQIPLNIYEGNRPVCQCHTADDAKRIVAAMNYYMRAAEFAASGVDPASRTGKISTRKP